MRRKTVFSHCPIFRKAHSKVLHVVRNLQAILSSVLIIPVVSYRAETWTLTEKEEKVLLIFERKIFRRIYGPKYENGEWKSRTNRELEEMGKGENIVKWIKGQKIS